MLKADGGARGAPDKDRFEAIKREDVVSSGRSGPAQ